MSDLSSSVAVDNSGHIYITGKSRFYLNPNYYEITTIKYSQTISGIITAEPINKDYKLYQNFPNPFNPMTFINYVVPSNVRHQTSNVKLMVYNSGKEIAVLVNQKQNLGSHSVTFNASGFCSGIYYYKLEIVS